MRRFLKTYAGPEKATEALRRSTALRHAGVTTPKARVLAPDSLGFDQIDGISGLSVLKSSLSALLTPLAQVHRATVPGLRPFDPFLRIRPREHLITSKTIARVLRENPPVGTATLHGDFHVGQLIRDTDGKVWIIDFDDLAIGPPEADLANFVAHLSTSDITLDLFNRLIGWSGQVFHIWRNLSAACDMDVFNSYLRIALVRRHLKLRQAGRPDFEAEIIDFLNAATVRTSPSDSAGYRD